MIDAFSVPFPIGYVVVSPKSLFDSLPSNRSPLAESFREMWQYVVGNLDDLIRTGLPPATSSKGDLIFNDVRGYVIYSSIAYSCFRMDNGIRPDRNSGFSTCFNIGATCFFPN